MLINIIGRVDHSGMGTHCRNFMQALEGLAGKQHKIRFASTNDRLAVGMMATRRPLSPQTTIVFWGTFHGNWQPIFDMPGRKIAWVVFESDRLADSWIETWANFDEIWVPSQWGRQILIQHGLASEKTIVVPEGVDPGRFQPDTQTHDKYRFLAVGKYEVRKGIDETIEAFCDAFPDSTIPVELWIKGDFFGDPQRIELLRAKARIDARIKLIEGVFPDDQLPKLYHSADAFVYPSRAEGWGLPCLEAIACGLPVLATNYSGHSEFLAPLAGHVIEIEWDLGPLVDPDYQSLYGAAYKTPDQGNWAIPRRSSIVSGMRALFENHAEWRAHGLAAAEIARHRFSWRASAELALSRIVGEEKVRSG